jgi:hypothetical protein
VFYYYTIHARQKNLWDQLKGREDRLKSKLKIRLLPKRLFCKENVPVSGENDDIDEHEDIGAFEAIDDTDEHDWKMLTTTMAVNEWSVTFFPAKNSVT